MLQVHADGENSIAARQLQQEELSVMLASTHGTAVAQYGGTQLCAQSALLEARAELFTSNQRCRDLEMSLLLKEEALEDRDDCLMHTREQLTRTSRRGHTSPCRLSCTPWALALHVMPV